jgi:hypothetical protein
MSADRTDERQNTDKGKTGFAVFALIRFCLRFSVVAVVVCCAARIEVFR